MPCYDHRDSPSYIEENTVKPLREEVEKLRKRNDYLASLLCETGQAFRKGKAPSAKVLEWWEEHEEFDRKRGEPW
jgi:hypothetical protein